MKSTLAITFTLLLILQMVQQVSTDIPKEWARNTLNQTSGEQVTVQPIGGNMSLNNSKNTNQSSIAVGSYYLVYEDKQNSTDLNQIPNKSGNETGPEDSTTPPSMTAANSSSPESNETQTQETATNSSSAEPEHTHQSSPNDTQTNPKPEANSTESNTDESGSGFLPSDFIPINTTKSPTTATEDVNGSTEGEQPEYPTFPADIPEDVTTESEESTENSIGQLDNRENSGRGSAQDPVQGVGENKNKAWAVVLIVGIAVGVIALTAFIVLNRKNRRDFSHRKLVEETSPNPVLRLDNSEPLDLKFDGFGYYNPGLEADNIQMTNFPQGRSK